MLFENVYAYNCDILHLNYEFESVGENVIIKKVARFSQFGDSIYNFGFGDLNRLTGEIDDIVVSNNGDGDKVLLTVASIIYDFTSYYPEASVFIQGTTLSRTRRYQIGINKNWQLANLLFDIFALKNENWVKFQIGINFEAFIITRRAPQKFNN